MKKLTLFYLLVLGYLSCSNDIGEVNAITANKGTLIEEATDVKILYSDSASLKVRITADKMIRHLDKRNMRDEFPDGIFVEFLSESGKPYSWLTADRATRYDEEKEFIVEGNDKFYNRGKDMLTSTELIWDEETSELKTFKFVRISQPVKGDTSYGFGLVAYEEFTRFEILRKTSAIFNANNFK